MKLPTQKQIAAEIRWDWENARVIDVKDSKVNRFIQAEDGGTMIVINEHPYPADLIIYKLLTGLDRKSIRHTDYRNAIADYAYCMKNGHILYQHEGR